MAQELQNLLALRPFGGNSDEDVEQFLTQVTAAMALQEVDEHLQMVNFTMLRLRGGP